jgi:hypothetical protein
MPTKARFTLGRYAVLATSILLGACAGDSTAPAPSLTPSQSATSPFVPSASAKSLVGVSDGTYTFTVDPRRDQALVLGANMLALPANAICDLGASSYGAGHWDESCTPATQSLVVTAVVRNAKSDHPSIDFYPAMRFSPDKNVSLYMYVPVAERFLKNDMVVKYCNDAGVCVDESVADPSLRTATDRTNSVVFRRIKHFSGYIIANVVSDVTGLLF